VAHLHFRRTPYYTGGGNAVARITYITGEHVPRQSRAEQLEEYVTRPDREDIVYAGTRNLPAWAQGKSHTYFTAAEQYERKGRVHTDGTVSRPGIAFEEWKLTLPQELSVAQNTALMHDLVEAIAGDLLPVTMGFHNPKTLDGTQEQPHLHLIMSARQTDAKTRTLAQHFQRPDGGGTVKDLRFWHKGAVHAHRVLIADVINAHLEANGQVARIHPKSLRDRGIERDPEPKLLPSESHAYRTTGKVSATMQQVLTTRAARDRIKEQNQARTYWEERKATLGITRDMPMGEKLQAMAQARQDAVDGPPARTPAEQLQHEQRAIKRAIQREHARTGRGLQGPRPRQTPNRHSSLAAQVQRLARALEQEEAQGHGPLRVQLHDREEERGLSW
jgi:MobA/MobL family